MILTIENLTKGYGEKELFTGVNLTVNEGDKIGIVGINGAGKSTLLKTIAGLIPADEGKISLVKGMRIGYLAQDKEFAPENTVLMEALGGKDPLMEALRRYETLLAAVRDDPADKLAEKQLSDCSVEIDELGGWGVEAQVKLILTKLGFSDFSRRVKDLSEGERKRLALAATLIQPADVLLLDEPTNHLDAAAIIWLEEYLAGQKSAFLMVTHDRYFLDNTAKQIFELDKGKVYLYTGNYTLFLEQKEARIERAEAEERKRQSFLRRELVWLRRGAQARSTKQKARIERYEEVKAQTVDLSRNQVEIGLAGSRLGRTVIELEKVNLSIAGKPVVKDFSYIVRRRDRLAVLGANGTGKSLLLDIFAGRRQPDSGRVEIGQTVKIGYFSQQPAEMDGRLRALEYIQEEAHHLTLADGTKLSASQLMERFLFPPDLQRVPVSRLSGGEKRRLFLLRLLMSAPNVLILDEPTNDLDLEMMTVLENFIEDFAGVLIFVSQDRFFIDRLAERICVPEGDGRWNIWTGGWTDNEDRLKPQKEETVVARPSQRPEEKNKSNESISLRKKLSFKEQKEYAEIEDIIASREGELKVVQLQMAECSSDYVRLGELTKEEIRLQAEIATLLSRWEYLESIVSNT